MHTAQGLKNVPRPEPTGLMSPKPRRLIIYERPHITSMLERIGAHVRVLAIIPHSEPMGPVCFQAAGIVGEAGSGRGVCVCVCMCVCVRRPRLHSGQGRCQSSGAAGLCVGLDLYHVR